MDGLPLGVFDNHSVAPKTPEVGASIPSGQWEDSREACRLIRRLGEGHIGGSGVYARRATANVVFKAHSAALIPC